jgi:hypothetical protein
MEKRGYLERRRIERELKAEVGGADVVAMRRVLLRLLERSGTLADAAAGRSRALW